MKDFVQIGFGYDDDDDDLKNKNDNNDVLLKSPSSSSTTTTTTTRGKDSHKMNNVVDDNINHAGNIIGNAIKKIGHQHFYHLILSLQQIKRIVMVLRRLL